MENIERKLKEHGLEHRHALGWQSKVGPKRTKWLSPSTPEVIQQSNEKAIFIVPVAFTTDHIETLDEIDIEFREYVEEAGKLFCRAECFNLEKSFIDLCGKLVQSISLRASSLPFAMLRKLRRQRLCCYARILFIHSRPISRLVKTKILRPVNKNR